MQKRDFILYWPVLLAPGAAMATTWLSGPVYNTAPSEAMLVRFLALTGWVLVVCVGTPITLIATRRKPLGEWVAAMLAGLGSVFVFFAFCFHLG